MEASIDNTKDNSSPIITKIKKTKPKSKKRCAMNGCKEKVTMIGHDCIHCNKRFCIKHCSMESHCCKEYKNCCQIAQENNASLLMKGECNFQKLEKI